MMKDVELTESETLKLKDEFEKLKKIHKNYFSSFEIITPKVSQSIVKELFTYSFMSGNLQENFWISLPKTGLFFDDMMTNYEREMGDNFCIQKEKIERTFYCCVNLLNSEFRKSEKWVVVGFMPVGKDLGIPWIWLHPYLRGQGIVRSFLREYALNYGPLMFETPIKPRLQKIIAELSEEIQKCPEKANQYCHGLRDWLERRYQGSLANISNEDIHQMVICINNIHFLKPDIERKDELFMVREMMKIKKYCADDPEKLKEIFPEVDLEELKNGNQMKIMMEDTKRRMTLGKIADSFLEREFAGVR